jgi:hypothetical protein
MKLVTTTLICLILVSSGMSSDVEISTGQAVAIIAILAGEVAIVVGGISSVISNTLYLNSDYREKPSVTAGFIWAGLNLGVGILIWSSIGDDAAGYMALGIGQTALGVAGGATTMAVANKPLTYGPTVLFDSEKKPIVGFSVHLRL